MDRAAVIGDYDSIYGFAAVGLATFPVETAEEAAGTLARLAKGGYAVIFITEAAAAQLTEEIARYSEQPAPAIILIPGVRGNTGEGMRQMKASVVKAVGSDVL